MWLGSGGAGSLRRRDVVVVVVSVSGCEIKTEEIGHPKKERINLSNNFRGQEI